MSFTEYTRNLDTAATCNEPKLSMSSNLVVFIVTTFVLQSTILYAFTLWSFKNENAVILKALRENGKIDILDSVDSLNRVSREAGSSQNAIEIINNALNELIEIRLQTFMECSRNENNQTDCSIKQGVKGEKGDTGAQGKNGPRGEPGVKGEKGQTGYKGDIGPQGSVGGRGPKGDMGAVGFKGEQGPTGPQGATGEIGARGEPGMKGNKGDHGYPGYKGSIGPMGEPGEQGPAGPKGDRGLQGERGQHGYPGYKGEKGEKGMTGPRGPRGPLGASVPSDEQTTASTSTTTLTTLVPKMPLTTKEHSTSITVATTTTTTSPSHQCGGPGWRRVVRLNMSNLDEHCPRGLRPTHYSVRSCGRTVGSHDSCTSVIFPVNGTQYSEVCGRVTGYRFGKTNGFNSYHQTAVINTRHFTIDKHYVDGLSLTYGSSPRKHIWTFASGLFNGSRGDGRAIYRCLCDEGNPFGSPPFVWNDYFCESVATVDNWNVNPYRFYPDNALWDGEGCQGTNNTCCKFHNPPWFKKTLSNSTSDDIELRLCFDFSHIYTDIGITLLELYVH